MDHTYLVAYDISDAATYRQVFRTMKGYGEWLQLSVFQCRLDRLRHAELIADLDMLIDHGEDHVVIADLGAAGSAASRVTSLGKRRFELIEPNVIIV